MRTRFYTSLFTASQFEAEAADRQSFEVRVALPQMNARRKRITVAIAAIYNYHAQPYTISVPSQPLY